MNSGNHPHLFLWKNQSCCLAASWWLSNGAPRDRAMTKSLSHVCEHSLYLQSIWGGSHSYLQPSPPPPCSAECLWMLTTCMHAGHSYFTQDCTQGWITAVSVSAHALSYAPTHVWGLLCKVLQTKAYTRSTVSAILDSWTIVDAYLSEIIILTQKVCISVLKVVSNSWHKIGDVPDNKLFVLK